MAPCANHPEAAAGRTCAVCGRAFCERCLVEFDGRAYCETCKESPEFLAAVSGPHAGPGAVPAAAAAEGGGERKRSAAPLLIGLGCLALCIVGGIGVSVLMKKGLEKGKAAIAPVWEEGCRDELAKIGQLLRGHRLAGNGLPARGAGESAAQVLERLFAGRPRVRRPDGDAPRWGCPGVAIREDFSAIATDPRTIEAESYDGFTVPFEGQWPADDVPIVWDLSPENHGGRGRNVLFADLSVHFTTEAEFQAMQKALVPSDARDVPKAPR